MLILSVDTSTRSGSVAILRGREVLGDLGTPTDEPYSSVLSAAVARLLESAGLALHEVEVFAVGAGPGSFTGLRVGLTAVKAWAEVFSRPIAAVSVLESIAAQATSAQLGPDLVAAVLDARRGQVFGGLFRWDAERLTAIGAEVVTSAQEFFEIAGRESDGRGLLFASPTPDLVRGGIAEAGLAPCEVVQVSGVLAPIIGRLGYEKALRGELSDALRLDANYLRRSDAELHWKE